MALEIKRVEDLAKFGLALSDDGKCVVPDGRVEPGRASDVTPDASWGAEQLTSWAKQRLDESYDAERNTTRLRFRAGHGFHMLSDLLKAEQEWIRWLKERGINPRHAWECIKLHKHFQTEEAAAKFRITEALIRAGATKPRRSPKVHDPPVIEDPPTAEEDGKAPLNGDEPPPPESPHSVRLALVRIADRLGQIAGKLDEIPPGDLPLAYIERSITHLDSIKEHANGVVVEGD